MAEMHKDSAQAGGYGPAGTPAAAPGPAVQGLIYASPLMAQLASRLLAVAGCDASLLIIGETGTGKEVCAQAGHYLSARRAQPWVAVNCGAIPGELVENELFGHARGAYTTAHQAQAGLVAEAEGGTLFLDDVDCLPLAAQAKLLRFLQEREYRPVGASRTLRANVRVIAASNGDLHALALRGAFRQDLYYRLNVVRLNVPALRQRREDILPLAMHFLRRYARDFQRPMQALHPAALRRLWAHDWPGNVRELQHVIERAVLLGAGPVLADADIEIEGPVGTADRSTVPASFREAKERTVQDFERGYLEDMLAAHGGNVTRAAQASHKDRRAFFELMRKHRIEAARFRSAQG